MCVCVSRSHFFSSMSGLSSESGKQMPSLTRDTAKIEWLILLGTHCAQCLKWKAVNPTQTRDGWWFVYRVRNRTAIVLMQTDRLCVYWNLTEDNLHKDYTMFYSLFLCDFWTSQCLPNKGTCKRVLQSWALRISHLVLQIKLGAIDNRQMHTVSMIWRICGLSLYWIHHRHL